MVDDKTDITRPGSRLNTPITRVLLAVTLLAVVPVAYWLWNGSTSAADLLREAQAAFEEGDAATAERLAERALSKADANPDAALLAGRAAAEQRRFEAAVKYYERVADDGSAAAVTARCEAGDALFLNLKRTSAAESQFRRAVKQRELNVRANNRLSQILGVTARYRDAVPFRLRLIRQDAFEPLHLYLICMGDSAMENLELLKELHQSSPDDPAVLLGMARNATDQQEYRQAISLLRRVVSARPDLIDARVKLGKLLLEYGEASQFLQWREALPQNADAYAELWFVRGLWAQRNDQPEAAIRCLWEAARLDPTHEAAHFQLSQTLIKTGDTAKAQPFLDRSRRLTEYFNTVKIAWTGKDRGAIRDAAEIAESLGLIWEAYGWARLAQQRLSGEQWASRMADRLKAKLPHLKYERTDAAANVASTLDLSNLPLPQFPQSVSDSTGGKIGTRNASEAPVRFVDRAADAGLVFRYHNRAEGEPPTRRMYEFNGGGVAILDYDMNGLPDIYLTEGSTWPPDDGQSKYIDRLFRNLGNGQFQEVSSAANIQENGFSGGATVGDYNGDGFADLYVANIGGNRFYENNGDGTFSDITSQTASAGDDWSTSCAMADFTGDGHADLYVVNYLEGADLYTRICPDSSGTPRSCSPRHFPAAQDRLFVNRGDGEFDDATNRAGIRLEDGKGLGIVAADLTGNGRLSAFVANDAVSNFCFVNRRGNTPSEQLFEEAGLITGLAVNEEGRPEACMGVAAGDADGDGRLDLFVTNFFNESNTLFRQLASEQFVDATRRSDLHDPSLKMLGFGTQFIDGELDGRPDLMVTNGHVDDLSDIGNAYQMPCQYFSNVGGGRYSPVPADRLGPFFSGKYLGRALARVDWNRDGLDDVVISHLDAPAALLTNATAKPGHFVALRLVGVQSSRDAIGTTLIAEVDGKKLMRQLTAGDGYQASNERRIVFGLGERTQIDSLHVRWPSGKQQQFKRLAAGSELLLIEGRLPLQIPAVDLR